MHSSSDAGVFIVVKQTKPIKVLFNFDTMLMI